jgi:adenine-specific DNA methylase
MDALRIGDKLVESGTISQEQLDEALAKQKELRDSGMDPEKTLVGIVLIQLGFITQQDLVKHLFDKKDSDENLSMAEQQRRKIEENKRSAGE